MEGGGEEGRREGVQRAVLFRLWPQWMDGCLPASNHQAPIGAVLPIGAFCVLGEVEGGGEGGRWRLD